jgi:hypothetical protein
MRASRNTTDIIMRSGLWACALLLAGNPFLADPVQSEDAVQSNDLDAIASKTTVYVNVNYYDPKTSTTKTATNGTGFLISEHGDVVTAYHVIKDWFSQDEDNQKKNPITVMIGSRFAEPLEVSYETGDKDADVALLRIRRPGTYNYAPFCYVHDLSMRATIVSYGFANGHELTPVSGTFSNANGDDNRWEAAVPFAQGMSGGPVYNDRGFVVGIVKGGIPSSDATSFITPIAWARALVEARTGVKPSCFGSCARPENGVASWGKTENWAQDTEWMGGGHNQSGECGKLQTIFMQTHPNEVLEITHTDERTDKDFLGHVTYQYICQGVVRSDPTYIVKESAACPPP